MTAAASAKETTLNADTILTFQNLTLNDGDTFQTNGHRLEIVVAGDLLINGTARIYSYGTQAAPRGRPGRPGSPGTSFDPGPGSAGAAPAIRGRDGGPGGPGRAGESGAAGANASPIIVRVRGSARGELIIENHGQQGGDGGVGGKGGDGGKGEQGGEALSMRRNVLGVKIAAGCQRGAGHGGNGGAGGAAGPGGAAGAGGAGGELSVTVIGNPRGFVLRGTVTGGAAGMPGAAGSPGSGGSGGYGGRGSPGCEGRVAERRGLNGSPGATSATGATAAAGRPGRMSLSPATIRALVLPTPATTAR